MFHIKGLKLLRHVSILRSSSGSYTFLATVTLRMILGSKYVGENLVFWCETFIYVHQLVC